MNPEILRLCEAVRAAGGRAMLVGGYVRDQLAGIESKDFDVEVYGLEASRLRSVIAQLGQVNTVGEHFSVYKLVFNRPAQSATDPAESASAAPSQRFEIDVSLPRRESKTSRGHRGFVIEGDSQMSFAEAARRRDFTINAILYDPLTGETIDPFGGTEDFERRILRAVAADTFVDDSLRVLRAVQLAARFELSIEPGTVELCRRIDLADLPRERIWGEIEKLLVLARRPSIGMDAARELGVLDKLFPALIGLANTTRSDSSQLDAFDHTKLALDHAATLAAELDRPQRIALLLATLCHGLDERAADIIKPSDSPATRDLSLNAVRSVLETLGIYTLGGIDVRAQVLALIRERSVPSELYDRRETSTDGDIRRLSARVDIELLYLMTKACAAATGTAAPVAADWLIERARSLGVEHGPPAPLLLGRHLLDAGVEPGPQMGQLLRRVYELQLDGEVTTVKEGLAAALGGPAHS